MGALPVTGHAKGAIMYRDEDVSHVPIEKRVARGMCLVPEKARAVCRDDGRAQSGCWAHIAASALASGITSIN